MKLEEVENICKEINRCVDAKCNVELTAIRVFSDNKEVMKDFARSCEKYLSKLQRMQQANGNTQQNNKTHKTNKTAGNTLGEWNGPSGPIDYPEDCDYMNWKDSDLYTHNFKL